jgi:hypothetical protein
MTPRFWAMAIAGFSNTWRNSALDATASARACMSASAVAEVPRASTTSKSTPA